MPVACEMMLGRSYYWPIYEAARHNLPIGLHAGSMYRYTPTSTGWPCHFLHDYVAHQQTFEDQLLSLISNGVFVKFPELRVVLHRIRRHLAARLHLARDQDLARRARRGALGEADRRRRSSASNAPDRAADRRAADAKSLDRIIDQIDSDDMLLFATDYPHWQFDGDDPMPAGTQPGPDPPDAATTIRWRPIPASRRPSQ